MVLLGKMYKPTDVAVDVSTNSVYVVEQFNNRISKWNYTDSNYDFTLDFGHVTSISINVGGTGYSVSDPVDISAPTLNAPDPINATAEVATVTDGIITTATISDGGNGYILNDVLTVDNGTGGTVKVIGETSGVITSISIETGGSGYSVGIETTTGGNGGGATVSINSITNGIIATITVTVEGNGYDPTNLPTVTATTGGSGAILTASVIGPWGNNGDGSTGKGAPIGDGGPNDNALYHPTGIVFEGNRLVVTDTFHNRIRTIAIADGAFIDSVGQGGTGISDFYRPTGIATNGAFLVIADELNHRAVRYTVGDTPFNPAVLDSPTPLPFNIPHGVIFEDTNDFFMVTDTFHGVISRYNTFVVFQDQFGSPGTSGTNLFFPGSGHGILTGDSTTTFADTRNNLLKTVANTTIANTTGTVPGTGDGELYYPESVNSFADTVNYVLAVNTRNHRVEAYSNTAGALSFEANFGSP